MQRVSEGTNFVRFYNAAGIHNYLQKRLRQTKIISFDVELYAVCPKMLLII